MDLNRETYWLEIIEFFFQRELISYVVGIPKHAVAVALAFCQEKL